MGIQDAGRLSLGEFAAISRAWSKAHGKDTAAPPSADEFDLAVMKARGAA